jgi:hypothetical protein
LPADLPHLLKLPQLRLPFTDIPHNPRADIRGLRSPQIITKIPQQQLQQQQMSLMVISLMWMHQL